MIKVYTENSLTPVEIFYGIPYATPPVGRYRLSAPESHGGWTRTFFAHRIPPRCPQIANGETDYSNEDCLFLNIWTPRQADGNSLPVVVILYSESWERGGIFLPCQELAAEGVVVVTVAYRLHLLSFFTLRSMSARGNLALLDQYLALLWVRNNIAAFGGDPAAITLLGHSAGADSVLYHIASPRAVGLFQKAIVMSPRDIWKTIDRELDVNATEIEQISREIAHSLGCTSSLDLEIIQCMRARSVSDIIAIYSKTNWSNSMQPVPDIFLPVTERYLPTSLSVALSAEKQPMQLDLLLGTTDLEIISRYNDDYEELFKRGSTYVTEYANTKAIPELLQMFSLHRTEALPLLIQAVRWEYWGGKLRNDDDRETLEALARMESSAKWGAGSALLAARLARRVARLFVYRYSHPGVDLQGRQLNFTGAVHGTDLVALLGDAIMLQMARRPATSNEKQISTTFRKYIANFIKFGSPGAEDKWQRYRAGDAHVHDIRYENEDKKDVHSASKETAFWLQYLPQLSNLLITSERSEQLSSVQGETRLRGGMFAMCGVSAVLLLLLFACALLLRKESAQRSPDTIESRL